MLKKSNLILILLSMCLFFSCDSLWQVENNVTNVAVELDIPNIVGQQQFSILQSGDMPDDTVTPSIPTVATVSLFNAKTNKLIESKQASFSNVEALSVTFEKIRIGTNIYATVEILGPNSLTIPGVGEEGGDVFFHMDPTLFRARSASVKIKNGENNLETRPNAVYLDPSIPDPVTEAWMPTPSNDNSGLNPNEPVLTFDRALEILKGNGSLLPGATIYIKDTLTYDTEATTVLDGQGVIVKKFAPFTKSIISVTNNTNLTLQNITIDGNSENFEDSGDTLISVDDDCNLVLNSGAILQNNIGNYYGGTLNISGGDVTINKGSVIQNNINEAGMYSAGAIYVDSGTCIMNGGLIQNNISSGEAGAICVCTDFTMNGGVIKNNRGSAGGIYANSDILITGGTITSNTATDTGGGIFLNGHSLNIKGNPVVSGNMVDAKENNVGICLSDDNSIVVTGTLDESARIGLSPHTGGTSTYVTVETGATVIKDDDSYTLLEKDVSKFFLDSNMGSLKFEESVGKVDLNCYYISSTISDIEEGTSENPFLTFEKAKTALKGRDGQIIITGEITITEDETWSADPGQTIVVRCEDVLDSEDYIKVSNGKEFSLQNITIEGDKSSGIIRVNESVDEQTIVNLFDGTVFQNCDDKPIENEESYPSLITSKTRINIEGFVKIPGLEYTGNENPQIVTITGPIKDGSYIRLIPKDGSDDVSTSGTVIAHCYDGMTNAELEYFGNSLEIDGTDLKIE